MGWDAEFSEPKGKNLTTLRDAAIFITKLPKAEHDTEPWPARALNRHVERVFDPSRKEKHCGRRKLARDR
jgi:hypothetical protein